MILASMAEVVRTPIGPDAHLPTRRTLEERLMVLARMTACVDALPVVGEEHVVVGEGRGREGRKTWTAATLYDSDGRVVARAEHTWVAVNPADFA